MKIPPKPVLASLAGAALTLGVISCNVFSPLDKPSGDEQLLSAARACLDRQDYACARENYSKLSDSQTDVGKSESALAILDENGAGFDAFAVNLGTSANGKGLTKFAESLAPGAGEAKRLKIYEAYELMKTMNNGELKDLTRFLTATALAAEILAEAGGADGVVAKADIAQGGDSCTALNCAGTPPACDAQAGSAMQNGAGDIRTTKPAGTNPTLSQLYTALNDAVDGLTALGASGDFSSTKDLFTGFLSGIPSTAADSACFRAALLSKGVGE